VVKLTKIYTRGGDGGETSLVGGGRVAKSAVRVRAIGAVDDANAAVGIVRIEMGGKEDAILDRIQNDLFDLGADLATPGDEAPPREEENALRITAAQVTRIEAEIDAVNADLEPLNSFVLPGGSAAAAHLHMARTVTRRAESLIAELAEAEPVNAEALKYMNRLSDLLFVLARRVNDGGKADVLWQPGENRE